MTTFNSMLAVQIKPFIIGICWLFSGPFGYDSTSFAILMVLGPAPEPVEKTDDEVESA